MWALVVEKRSSLVWMGKEGRDVMDGLMPKPDDRRTVAFPPLDAVVTAKNEIHSFGGSRGSEDIPVLFTASQGYRRVLVLMNKKGPATWAWEFPGPKKKKLTTNALWTAPQSARCFVR